MNASISKLRKCLWPGLAFVFVCFLALAPAKQANAGVANGCGDNLACPVCGDGIKGPGEECDDGGRCSNNPDKICNATETATEEQSCTGDDGECVQDDEDGCHNDCTLCPRCGNGITEVEGLDGVQAQEPGEECDDGMQCEDGTDCTGDPLICNNIGDETCSNRSGDGCQANCQLPTCGDGICDDCCDVFEELVECNEEQGEEQCDDGNESNQDLCNNDCSFSRCGDDIVQPELGEQCDDGNTLFGDGCFDCQECPNFFCGDGKVNTETEECDDGNDNNEDTCDNSCHAQEHCGNGEVDENKGEECDGENDDACGDDDCRSDCTCEEDECPPGGDDNERHRACTAEEEDHKTTICHIPPGNSDNAHTLCVGTPSVPAHLAHGDDLGECAPEDECVDGNATLSGQPSDPTPSDPAAGGCSLVK